MYTKSNQRLNRNTVVAAAVAMVAFSAQRDVQADEAKVNRSPPANVQSAEISAAGVCHDAAGLPIKDAVVRLFVTNSGDHTQRELQQTHTDKDGKFRLAQPVTDDMNRPRARLVAVAQMRGMTTDERSLKSRAGELQKLEFKLRPAGMLQGRLTDSTGRPVAGAFVRVGHDLAEPVVGIRAARTDENGHYEISDFPIWDAATAKPQIDPDGRTSKVSMCIAHVRHPDFAPAALGFTKVPSTVNLVLHKPAHLEGHVVLDENGEPAVNAKVSLRNDAPAQGRGQSDALGHYAIADLQPGRYMLSARVAGRPAFIRGDVDLREGKNTLDLRLPKGGVIHGQITDVTTHSPVVLPAGETIQASIGLSSGGRKILFASANVEPDGTFTLQAPAGRMRLGFYVPGNWRFLNSDKFLDSGVMVVAGQSTEVALRIKPWKPEDEPRIPLRGRESHPD